MEYNTVELFNCNKKLVGVALVSPEDYNNIKKYNWNMHVCKLKNGARNYALGTVDGRLIKMHQVIMGKPPKEGLVIDHKNGDSLDNQRSNLRFVTRSANAQNKKKIITERTTSKFIGVQKRNNKFIIEQGGIEVGRFDDEIDAAKHYDKYVTLKYNGDCKTNFPVSHKDIEGITLDDLILTSKKLRTLPENITYYKKDKKYYACKSYQGEKYTSKFVDTLDEALEELEAIKTRIKDVSDKFVKKHYEREIERNDDGAAIIHIRNKENQVVGQCIVDDEYWHELTLFKWHICTVYAKTNMKRVPTLMHVYLMKKIHTELDVIDHINHNPLDNRMSNLRSVTAATNAHNKTKKKGCASKYIGVRREDSKWAASIKDNYKAIRLGRFVNEIDAARAYNEKAKEIYGENANLNVFDLNEED